MMGRRSVVAAAAGLLVGLGLLTWWLSPRVIAWGPSDREIPATAALELRFNTAVEAASARRHVAVDPRTPGRVAVDGPVLRFQPGRPWPAGETVTVTVHAGLRGRNGVPSL
ncbi:MAG: Ig-like domain-containing protein, partial [Candidatus Promineifilaceae bacterium]|nr:Ig-like domain-containing protein [Candidatus Promineifilaceae bacterium]